MSDILDSKRIGAMLRRAAVRATLAPSVHNTQPWRFVLAGDELRLEADRSRQLAVLDPNGRQLILSLGCALFNARAALAELGVGVRVGRFPDPARPDLVATVSIDQTVAVDECAAELASAVELRRTNRREFAAEPVPADVVAAFVRDAASEGARLIPVERAEHRLALARLSRQADRAEVGNPAYRAELRAWTTDDPRRTDGVPFFAVPHVDKGSDDEIPLRDFDTSGMGWLPTRTHSSTDQCLVLLGTASDDLTGWLRAGEALEHVLLDVADRRMAASPMTQAIEVASTRQLLRQELGLTMFPHIVLRVGFAPLTMATRRRRLVEVLTETG